MPVTVRLGRSNLGAHPAAQSNSTNARCLSTENLGRASGNMREMIPIMSAVGRRRAVRSVAAAALLPALTGAGPAVPGSAGAPGALESPGTFALPGALAP